MTLIERSARVREIEYDRGPYNLPEVIYVMAAAFTCDECSAMSIGEMVSEEHRSPSQAESILSAGQVELWQPLHGVARAFPDAPSHIGEAATEAFRCHSIGAHRAACSLARAVIEATAKNKGITVNGIYQKIEALATAGLIRGHIQEAAHEVRHLGNETAHGDFVDPVSEEDAALALELMADVLEEVYASPARVERARAARELRRQGAAES